MWNRSRLLVTVLNQGTPTIEAVKSAPPFSLGAIVTFEIAVPDGQIIKFVDPVYRELARQIEKDRDIIYQINPRKWEEIVAAAYDKEGFDIVILTPHSGDLGRDVIAIKMGPYTVKFVEQVKAYKPGHLVTANDVRALVGVLAMEQDASKAIFTTTSEFAPRITEDRLIKPLIPDRLELVPKDRLIARLVGKD